MSLSKDIFTHRLAVLVAMLMICFVGVSAQGKGGKPRGFDPKRFEAELEQYIVTKAALTPTESAKFFPVYRKMGKKMRMLFDEMRRYHHANPKDNEACAEAIRRQDEIDIEMKQLQQEYHAKFMLILPASKVLSIIKAEGDFHRQAFKRMHK